MPPFQDHHQQQQQHAQRFAPAQQLRRQMPGPALRQQWQRPTLSAPCSPSKPLAPPQHAPRGPLPLQQRLAPLAHHNSAPHPAGIPAGVAALHHAPFPSLPPRQARAPTVDELAVRPARSVSPSLSAESAESYHVLHKVPQGDSPYVRAKHVQLVDKDPERAIALFWCAINAGDRVDSALKDMAIVMKQQNRADEAIEAIKSLRHKCSDAAQESLDNVLLDLYKRCGRLDDQVTLLKHKLDTIRRGVAFNGKRTKTARSQGKKFQVSVEQEATRLLGNLGWAYMQQDNFVAAETVYRKALAIEPDNNKVCNLGICLMKQGRVEEARVMLKAVTPAGDPRWGSESHLKSFERAQEMLKEIEAGKAASTAAKPGSEGDKGPQVQHTAKLFLAPPRNLPMHELLGAPSQWDSLLVTPHLEAAPQEKQQQQKSAAGIAGRAAAPSFEQALGGGVQRPLPEQHMDQSGTAGPACVASAPTSPAPRASAAAQAAGPYPHGFAMSACALHGLGPNSRAALPPKSQPPRQHGLLHSQNFLPRMAPAYAHASSRALFADSGPGPAPRQPLEIAPAPYVAPPQPQPQVGLQDSRHPSASALKPSAQPFLPAAMLRDLHQSCPNLQAAGLMELYHNRSASAPAFNRQQSMEGGGGGYLPARGGHGPRFAHAGEGQMHQTFQGAEEQQMEEMVPSPRDPLVRHLSGVLSFGSSTSTSSAVSWEGSGFTSPPISDDYFYTSAAPDQLTGGFLGQESQAGFWPGGPSGPHVSGGQQWARPVPAEVLKQRLEEERERQRQKEALLANSSLQQGPLSHLPNDLYTEPGPVGAGSYQASAYRTHLVSRSFQSYPSSVASSYEHYPSAAMSEASGAFLSAFGQRAMVQQHGPADVAPLRTSKDDVSQVGLGSKRNRVPTPTKGGSFPLDLLLPNGLLASAGKGTPQSAIRGRESFVGARGVEDLRRSWENLGFTASPGLLDLGQACASPAIAVQGKNNERPVHGPARSPLPLGLSIVVPGAPHVYGEEAFAGNAADAEAGGAVLAMKGQDVESPSASEVSPGPGVKASPTAEAKRQRRLRIFEEMSVA